MKLSAPKFVTFLVSLILFALVFVGQMFLPASITAILTDKILFIAAYALLALACIFKGL